MTDVSLEQSLKAYQSILLTSLPMLTDVRPEQPSKALCPILVTLLGMATDVRLEQPLKASKPMFFTFSGITVFLQPAISVLEEVSMIALQFSRLSYLGLPDATVMDVRPEQPEYLYIVLYQ